MVGIDGAGHLSIDEAAAEAMAEAMDDRSKGLDTLLLAAETLPHGRADAGLLDLFRISLRIARSTEAAVDLQRADLAFKALPERMRRALAERASVIARQEAERALAYSDPVVPRPGLLATLLGRPAATPSGSTAKDRLLRELSRNRLPDD